jgi:cytochrome c biogenesis protein CcdA
MAYDDPRTDSLTGIFGKIIDDVRELFREEVALARAELRQEVSQASTVGMQFAAGGVAAGFAAMFLLLGVSQGFAMLVGWPVWAGYLTMAIVLGIGAFIAVQMGRTRARTLHAVPPQTVETLKETKEWIHDRITSARK